MTLINEMDKYAKQWIKEAGERIKASFETVLNIEEKSNANDLVTNIDKEIETFFWNKINETFPTHRMLGEEGNGHDIEELSGYVWIIDPIDGTLNFIHQQCNFAISVAVFKDGVGLLGFVYDVVGGELFSAVKGEGAYVNDKQLLPLQKVSVAEAILAVNARWLVENKQIDPNALMKLVYDVRGTRSYGSAALEIAYVAAGRVDAYISMRLSPWDFAGGIVILEEVGGKASDIIGNEIDYIHGSSLFVAKPGLHDGIVSHYFNDKS